MYFPQLLPHSWMLILPEFPVNLLYQQIEREIRCHCSNRYRYYWVLSCIPMDDITDFLYLIGSVFAPMIAIQIADFFLLKLDKSNQAVHVPNMIIWVIGFIAYRILMNIDMPVGNTLPDMVITIILCLIVGKLFPVSKKR